MKVISLSKLRKLFPQTQLDIAARVDANLDELCARIDAKPQLKRYKVSGGEEKQYKCIYFQLSSGAFASLTQDQKRNYARGVTYVSENFEITHSPDYKIINDDNWPNVVDIELQTNANDVVYEEDLVEIATELGIDLKRVEKFDNNKWRAYRRKG